MDFNLEQPLDPLANVSEGILLGTFLSRMKAPPDLSTKEWAEENRVLTADVSPKPGRYDAMVTPYMLRVMQSLDDPKVRVVTGKKSAQIAWTETINNYFGKRMTNDPCNMIIGFPTRAAGTSYSAEKLKPYIRSTPSLFQAVGNPDRLPWDRITYPGGFMKLVTAGSISNIKSTTASVVDVEEPDDLKEDVSNQGDALTILKERLKAHPDSKFIFGGTPANKGSSKVDLAYEAGKQFNFYVPCHLCGEFHVLDFQQLKVDPYEGHRYHKIYGEFDLSTVRYECPHCGGEWTFDEKNKNVANAINFNELGWIAENPEADEDSFNFNELLSPFAGSTFYELAKKRAIAYTEYATGDDKKLKSWINNSEGEAYSPPDESLDPMILREKALTYPLGVVPKGGVILVAGVDVQHNRFHLIVRAYGNKASSWLIKREEIFGNVLDYSDPVWNRLKRQLLMTYPLEGYPNIQVGLSALSIDSSDGNTSEMVYNFTLSMNALGLKTLATKGSSELGSTNVEIFTQPTNKLKTADQKGKSLAETMGVAVYIVGSNKAKDTILRQLRQTGNYDRLYYPQAVNPAYYEQMLSNTKRLVGRKMRYELIPGRRDEDLDCEQLCLHASRSLYVHLWSDEEWEQAYMRLISSEEPQSKTKPVVNVTKGLGITKR